MSSSFPFMERTVRRRKRLTERMFIQKLDHLTACRDQLYFDRVHSFAPFLHQRRYYSWNRQPAKTESRTCLQYAMWTLATSLSAQLQNTGDSLYRDTRQRLEVLDLKDTSIESIDIEQVQAWILMAIYEFMCTYYRRGWMSAGRAFRLIQLMRLHTIDVPNCMPMQIDWVETEEKRRTFWMAYSLDRFISMRNEWPLTLSDLVVSLFDCSAKGLANLSHADHGSSSSARNGIPKRPAHSYGIRVRSDYCERSKRNVALYTMHYLGNH